MLPLRPTFLSSQPRYTNWCAKRCVVARCIYAGRCSKAPNLDSSRCTCLHPGRHGLCRCSFLNRSERGWRPQVFVDVWVFDKPLLVFGHPGRPFSAFALLHRMTSSAATAQSAPTQMLVQYLCRLCQDCGAAMDVVEHTCVWLHQKHNCPGFGDIIFRILFW